MINQGTWQGRVSYDLESCIFFKQHAVVSFGGLVLGSEEGKRIAAALGSTNKSVILENHG
jgi:hypothetical protein